ncbi:helix-turn-helix domain-containing protein [Chryseobacterium indologenes]|uniref:helix-turn-helix domain-containing protein n=1 Tax=Chryseobacterium indologenes TaxID=253 RepID=UPI0022DF179D|nr:AraC family transcriptional regulator [Chryseobacterium indologenes]
MVDINRDKMIGYFGLLGMPNEIKSDISWFNKYYKIVFINKGGRINVDFIDYDFEESTLLFFSIGQYFKVCDNSKGSLVYFSPDFYCIAFHDKELACDGLLFDNVFELPYIDLTLSQEKYFQKLLISIQKEIKMKDFWAEEMIKTYIKQIVISATRTLGKKNDDTHQAISYDKDLTRRFSQLIELHYRTAHNVSDYALMLNITPKSLNRKIVTERQIAPNVIIKNRIILQAKRMLANTQFSIKEIAAYLGYEDYSYFVRFFKLQTGVSPLSFRNATQISANGKNVL